MPPVYLDYQASMPLLPEVKTKMMSILDTLSGNPHASSHLHGREASLIVETARDQVAELIRCEPENLIFTSGATESNNFLVKKGAALNPERKTILVSKIEHKCVLETAYSMRRNGYIIKEIDVDPFGQIDREHFYSLLGGDVALISIMAANNEVGTILNLPPLIAAAHQAGALFHTDAAQIISHADFDVTEIGADLVSLSAHKMDGPKGIGAAYIAPHIFEEFDALIYGGGQQDGKRAGTLSPLLCGGFGEAASQFVKRGSQIRYETKAIRDHFYHGLSERAGEKIKLIGPALQARHASNLNIQMDQLSSEFLGRIAPYISASNGSACASGQIDVSHVLRALGLTTHEAEHCVRFSFGVGLSYEDIDLALSHITTVLKI